MRAQASAGSVVVPRAAQALAVSLDPCICGRRTPLDPEGLTQRYTGKSVDVRKFMKMMEKYPLELVLRETRELRGMEGDLKGLNPSQYLYAAIIEERKHLSPTELFKGWKRMHRLAFPDYARTQWSERGEHLRTIDITLRMAKASRGIKGLRYEMLTQDCIEQAEGRMVRTALGHQTQALVCFGFEGLFGKLNVKMSLELDEEGIDMIISPPRQPPFALDVKSLSGNNMPVYKKAKAAGLKEEALGDFLILQETAKPGVFILWYDVPRPEKSIEGRRQPYPLAELIRQPYRADGKLYAMAEKLKRNRALIGVTNNGFTWVNDYALELVAEQMRTWEVDATYLLKEESADELLDDISDFLATV